MTALRPDLLLDDGACLYASGRILRVIAAPGHTPGTILLLEPATGALFTGDQILPRLPPSSGFLFDAGGRRRPSLPAYLASLRASRELADETRSFYPGHGDPAEGPADAVDWTVRLLEQRARRALAALRRGPGTAYDLALRMFPHLTPHHLRAAIAETVGLLDLLTERTLALAEETSDAVIWQATTPPPAPGMPDGTGGSLTHPEAHA
jgi:glyoxylase-like metal-dependent hydrolase (beta-lactamase superfamily II)